MRNFTPTCCLLVSSLLVSSLLVSSLLVSSLLVSSLLVFSLCLVVSAGPVLHLSVAIRYSHGHLPTAAYTLLAKCRPS